MEILWIALGACGIALVVFLLKKFVPGLKSEPAGKVDEKKEAEDNVNRMTVRYDPEEENKDNEDDK